MAATRTANSASWSDVDSAMNGTGAWTVAIKGPYPNGGPLLDGDTLVIPKTVTPVTWSSPLIIKKGLTVRGFTTVDISAVPGTPPGSVPITDFTSIVNDQTTIKSTGVTIVIQPDIPTTGKRYRISQLTFGPSPSNSSTGIVNVNGVMTQDPTASGNPGVRIDQCHFAWGTTSTDLVHTFDCSFGVIDHCLIDMNPSAPAGPLPMLFWNSAYVEPGAPGGVTRIDGEGSWADHANWGSYKFWFVEDCIFNGFGAIDAKQGARYVFRHNYGYEGKCVTSHGTEECGSPPTHAERGVRAVECYENTFYKTAKSSVLGQMRSGNILFHDNDCYGGQPQAGIGLTLYRENQPFTGFGGVQGSNPWDVNDVTNHSGNGFGGGLNGLYASGQHSGAASGDGATAATLTTSVPLGTLNQWVNYAITNLDQTNTKPNLGYCSGLITSNGTNTVVTPGQATVSFRPVVMWLPGDHFEIRRPIFALDQSGRGKCNFISYGANATKGSDLGGSINPPGLNQLSEPSYSWNNRWWNGSSFLALSVINCASGLPTILSGGAGAYDATKSYYTRAPGTSTGDPAAPFVSLLTSGYTTYTYPHPLTNISTSPQISSDDNFTCTAGVSPNTFQVTSSGTFTSVTYSHGTGFPANATLSSTGLLTIGSTVAANTYNFNMIATYSGPSSTYSQPFSLTVNAVSTKVIILTGPVAGQPIDFGDVDVNLATSPTLILNIANDGNSALSVSGITLPTGYTADWPPVGGGTIASKSSRDVVITFDPTTMGSYNGTVSVASNADNAVGGVNTIGIKGVGVARIPAFSPGDLDFDGTTVGQSPTLVETITNNGNRTLTIGSISYPTGYSGVLSSATVAAGATETLTVKFQPTVVGTTYSGDVSFVSNKTSGPSKFAVTGTGVATATKIIELSPSSLAFGGVQTSTTATLTLTIANSGTGPLSVSSITYPTGYSGAFSGTIPALGSHDVTVTFAPVSAISYNGTITVNSDKTSGTNTVSVTGSGVVASTKIISLSGDIFFGPVAVGSNSTATLNIANTGSAPLHISGISYPSGSVYSGTFTGDIAPNQSRDVTITFTPTTAGQSYNATVTVNSDKTSGTNTFVAHGQGAAAATKVIAITGNLAFGNVQINHSVERFMHIASNGTAPLNVTNITTPNAVFVVNWSSGTIQPNGVRDVKVTFTPTNPTKYQGQITVVCSTTSGNNQISCSGVGKTAKQVPMFLVVN